MKNLEIRIFLFIQNNKCLIITPNIYKFRYRKFMNVM